MYYSYQYSHIQVSMHRSCKSRLCEYPTRVHFLPPSSYPDMPIHQLVPSPLLPTSSPPPPPLDDRLRPGLTPTQCCLQELVFQQRRVSPTIEVPPEPTHSIRLIDQSTTMSSSPITRRGSDTGLAVSLDGPISTGLDPMTLIWPSNN